MNYLELFAGIGGFRLGIQQAYETNNNQSPSTIEQDRQGGNGDIDVRSALFCNRSKPPLCIGYSEIDKYAIQIYEKQFPNTKNYGDITKIRTDELPNFDLLVGGFPCQAFSIAGKRMGFSDTRGTLFFEIARIIRDKKPKFLLLENVKGLLSHDNQRTFETILCTISELGYSVEWQVLNSKDFGVPQNRERVFIIGHLGGFRGRQIFPIGESNINTIQGGKKQKDRMVSNAIDSSYYKGADGKRQMIEITKNVSDAQRVYDPKGIAKTLKGLGEGQGAKTGLYAVSVKLEGYGGKMQLKENKDDIAYALRATEGGSSKPFIKSNTKIRRLTPTECERLQGFPDGWTEGVSDTQRYKCLGNAVTVNVVREITKKLFYE
jgi:DNA (cytosine-5)-methyltransferase 1